MEMTSPDPAWRRLLSELAESDAPQVIEEARAGARARARVALEDALVDELLRAVAQNTGRRTPEHPALESHPAAADRADPDRRAAEQTGDAWWVYCVVSSDQAAELASGLTGVEPGSEVTPLVQGELAALVSRVPLSEYGDERLREHLEDINWLERTARAHETVQESVMQQCPLVPLRMCTIYRDLDGVRHVLEQRSDLFAENLAAVQDCAEWGVKVFFDLRGVPAEAAAETRGASGTDYLTSRQRERDRIRQADEFCVQCAEEVHGAVSTVARQDRVNPAQPPEAHGRDAEMVLNAAYLVEHDRIQDLKAVVVDLSERWAPHGQLVELTGPWPPYNFVSDSAGLMS
jgi:hypothetical protein